MGGGGSGSRGAVRQGGGRGGGGGEGPKGRGRFFFTDGGPSVAGININPAVVAVFARALRRYLSQHRIGGSIFLRLSHFMAGSSNVQTRTADLRSSCN